MKCSKGFLQAYQRTSWLASSCRFEPQYGLTGLDLILLDNFWTKTSVVCDAKPWDHSHGFGQINHRNHFWDPETRFHRTNDTRTWVTVVETPNKCHGFLGVVCYGRRMGCELLKLRCSQLLPQHLKWRSPMCSGPRYMAATGIAMCDDCLVPWWIVTHAQIVLNIYVEIYILMISTISIILKQNHNESYASSPPCFSAWSCACKHPEYNSHSDKRWGWLIIFINPIVLANTNQQQPSWIHESSYWYPSPNVY